MIINYQEYAENNIQFRVVSSKMMERFKSTQSFVLSEMIHGEYKFSKTSKEIAILAMDSIFGWVVSLENYLIRDGVDNFDSNAKEFAISKALEIERYYVSIIEDRDDIFDPRFVKVWKKNHILKLNLVLDILNKLEGMSDIEAFSTVVNTLIEMMDSIKFELYEMDYLISGGTTPFLCMTDLCILVAQEFKLFILPERAKMYIEEFGIEDGFVFKNYSQEINPMVYLQALDDAGIKINNKYTAGQVG